MEIKATTNRKVDIYQAKEIQKQLALLVSRNGEVIKPRFIAGIDITINRASKIAQGAVVVLGYPKMDLIEMKIAKSKLGFPYIPGLLSFRELPLMLSVYNKLAVSPNLIIVDGHGVAHPRKLGIASHLGLLLNKATIGCAKSRLCGSYIMPSEESGKFTTLVDKGESIGAVLRTKNGVRPVFISTGHKISFENAVYWVMQCCNGYRLPEPTRLAHLAAGGKL
jgi:deoxyribonuclease V